MLSAPCLLPAALKPATCSQRRNGIVGPVATPDQHTSDDLVSPFLATRQSSTQVRPSSGDDDGMTTTVELTEVLRMVSVETCSSRS